MKGNLSGADWDGDSRLVRRILPYLHSFRWSPGHIPPSIQPFILPPVCQYATCVHLCTWCALHQIVFVLVLVWPSSCFWSLSPVDKRVLAELSWYRLQRKWEKLNYFCLFRFRFLQDITLCSRTFFEYF